MIHSVGLLPSHNVEQIPFAYEVYKRAKDTNNVKPPPKDAVAPKHDTNHTASSFTAPSLPGSNNGNGNIEDVAELDEASGFKKTFSLNVDVDFVGVWDIVASVGAFWPRTLPWIDYNPSIRTFPQALALDEHRGSFIPSVWDHRRTVPEKQDVREVWFRGEHSDIGGGAPPESNEEGETPYGTSMLSNIPLRWMIRQILECQTGILLDPEAVQDLRKANILERPPQDSEKNGGWDWVRRVEESIKLDQNDVERRLYDSFGFNPVWHALEYFPVAKPCKNKNFEPRMTRMQVMSILKPRVKWHGYGTVDWPRIEDVLANQIDAIKQGTFPLQDKTNLEIERD
ncbi:choline transport protein [Ceratobasidium sp. AG-Ba]|nr:choline transport protein [Ceratobasidium sp. AG-Ba]QRW07611.1 choline transport protein [Ceratobasidium sp. AG-Ba]